MATLTEVSVVARKGIKYGLIGLVVIMMIPVVWRLGVRIYLYYNPPPPPPPTVAYGKLPNLVFPANSDDPTPEYKLETITGGFPKLPNVARVYAVGINRSRLTSLDRIRDMARRLSFPTELVPLDEQNYRFVHPRVPAELIFNIITWQFAYKYDWTSELDVYTNHDVPLGNNAIGLARQYLSSIDFLSEDLKTGNARFRYLIATGSAMVPTDSFYDANFTRVDLFRDDKDKMKVLTAGGDQYSPVNVTFSGLKKEFETNRPMTNLVVSANYYYSMTVDTEFETYPLKPVSQAYDELLKGQAFIAKRTTPKVTIRDITLAYYEPDVPQNYLQPIYAFSGDAGFMAYVPAVASELTQPTPTPEGGATPTPASPVTNPTDTPPSLPTTN